MPKGTRKEFQDLDQFGASQVARRTEAPFPESISTTKAAASQTMREMGCSNGLKGAATLNARLRDAQRKKSAQQAGEEIMSFSLKPQKLRQGSDRDCAVAVFAALAGTSYQEVIDAFPGRAVHGLVRPGEWVDWLKNKGCQPTLREGCPDGAVPCAHLVADHPMSNQDFHWVYRDEDGDVHDPSPVFFIVSANHPSMRSLSAYNTKVLTISVNKQGTDLGGPVLDRSLSNSDSS
jgi:hypothetical protein